MESKPRYEPKIQPPAPPAHQVLARGILKVQDWLMKTGRINAFVLVDKKHGVTYGDLRATAMAAVGLATISEKLPPNARGSATLIDALDDAVMLDALERIGGTLCLDKNEWRWKKEEHAVTRYTLRELLAAVRAAHDTEVITGGR